MTRCFGWLLTFGVLAGSMVVHADQDVSITVRPAIASAKGNTQVKVLVTRNELNRQLVWEVDGPNYYRSSAIELAGAAAPRSYMFVARDLPAGSYEVRVRVRRTDDSIVMDRSRILVVGVRKGD